MSAAMTMMASSRTGKNRSWRRASRSLTAACAADPAELSACAVVAAAVAASGPASVATR